jgi:hypothetical protein
MYVCIYTELEKGVDVGYLDAENEISKAEVAIAIEGDDVPPLAAFEVRATYIYVALYLQLF